MADQQHQHPLVSVVIVNYKVTDFVRQALQSLREAKLYDRSEVIVVDNASLDDSEQPMRIFLLLTGIRRYSMIRRL